MSVNVTEYQHLATDGPGATVMAGQEPSRAAQNVEAGTVSQAFSDVTRFVRIQTTEDIRIKFGESPQADGTSTKLGAGATEFFGVHPYHKVSVIAG